MIDPVVGALLDGAFAVLFASAALQKLRDLAVFGAAFRAYRIVPAQVPLHALVPLLELSLVVALLDPSTRRVGAAGGAVLLLVYALAIGINLRRRRYELSCGCDGPNERRPIAAWMVGRNTLLAAALAAAALPWYPRSLEVVDCLTLVGGLAVLTLLYMSVDRLLGRVAPRSALWKAP